MRHSLSARVVASLSSFSDAELDLVTAGSDIAFDRRWFRLLETIELGEVLLGSVELRYLIVEDGSRLVAVCPLLVAMSDRVYFGYSLDGLYFDSWQAELLRVDPSKAAALRVVEVVLAFYRRVLRGFGALAPGWVLAVSPIFARADIATAPLPDAERARVRAAAIEGIQAFAADLSLPACFYGVEEEAADLRRELAERDFTELFFAHDNLLVLPDGGLDGYLAQFRSERRRGIKREMQRPERAGLDVRAGASWSDDAGRIAELYELTARRYGDAFLRLSPEFWRAIERQLGESATVVKARLGSRLVGFAMFLHKRDLWAFKIGRDRAAVADGAGLHFALQFRESIRLARALGLRRIWFGLGGWRTKRLRGAVGYPLYNYLWLPRRRSKLLLLPYIRAFSGFARRELAFAERPSSVMKR